MAKCTHSLPPSWSDFLMVTVLTTSGEVLDLARMLKRTTLKPYQKSECFFQNNTSIVFPQNITLDKKLQSWPFLLHEWRL